MPTYVQRYNIDEHLGRHEKALENLSKADDSNFPECLVLAPAYFILPQGAHDWPLIVLFFFYDNRN